MKRIAIVAAALLGTACISSSTTTPPPPTTGSVDLGWSFLRYRLTDASWLTYTCAVAQVDDVVVSSSTGQVVTVPCSDSLGDGATIGGIWTGTQNLVVTGRRGGVALYQSDPFTVTVAQDQLTTVPATVQALGIPGNMYVYADFLDQFGGVVPNWTTCGSVLVTSLTFELRDSAENVIASDVVDCTNPPGVSFVGPGAIDLDNYAIRMKAYRNATVIFDSASTAFTPSCTRPAFDHLANGDSWDVPLYDVTQNGTLCP